MTLGAVLLSVWLSSLLMSVLLVKDEMQMGLAALLVFPVLFGAFSGVVLGACLRSAKEVVFGLFVGVFGALCNLPVLVFLILFSAGFSVFSLQSPITALRLVVMTAPIPGVIPTTAIIGHVLSLFSLVYFATASFDWKKTHRIVVMVMAPVALALGAVVATELSPFGPIAIRIAWVIAIALIPLGPLAALSDSIAHRQGVLNDPAGESVIEGASGQS